MRKLSVPALALAALLIPAPALAADPGRWTLTRESSIPLPYYQGITADPARDLYFSGHVGLFRTDSTLADEERNADVIPPEVHVAEGYNHIGDLTYDAREGGRLLLPMECYYPGLPNNGNTCPRTQRIGTGSIGVADPQTLRWRYYIKLDQADIKKAMWAQVTPDGESLWTQDGNDLLRYDLDDISEAKRWTPGPDGGSGPTIKPVQRLVGAVPPSGITGATFYEGRMYVAGQGAGGDATLFQVSSIDTTTGARRLEIERRIVGESEGLATVRALNGVLQWQIEPYNEKGLPTYEPTNGKLLSFLPASTSRAFADDQGKGGISCLPQDGVRFCEGSVATRVKSFDGVPLDVNVTLPAEGEGPFPLVVQLHGYGGKKGGLGESASFARDGYAVLNYSARGFGESCGSPQSRLADPQGCAKGYVRLADTRYEVRDSQYLAGLLADQGIADPQRIGAMGPSYGGGQSLSLATLRDRIRLPDGSYAPWTSPKGKPMRIAAAVPSVPWSDLAYSLVPNGRTLDYAVTGPKTDLDPIGTLKTSFVAGLFASGQTSGYYAPPGTDPDSDLTTYFARVNAGDPYDGDPVAESIIDKIARFKSPYYLDMDRTPAPLLISNGFTDDLFPVDEAVRYANKAKALYPDAVIAQLHFDYGHMRGQNKAADTAVLTDQRRAFFARYLKGDGTVTPPSGVTAMTQTCPKSAPSGGPFQAATWNALSPGEVRFAGGAAQTISPASGNPVVAKSFDPVAGGGACAQVTSDRQPGVATYDLPKVTTAYTLLGSPTILADLGVIGTEARIAMRLLDVGPDGNETLVARGLYRPIAQGGRDVFQLHPGAWRFEAGHVARLELLGQDAPYGRQGNLPTPVDVTNLELRLPVAEQPGSGAVVSPAPDPGPGADAGSGPGVAAVRASLARPPA